MSNTTDIHTHLSKRRVYVNEMDAVDFLNQLTDKPRFRDMVDCIVSDVPWNCMHDGSGSNALRPDDSITQDAIEKVCGKIKVLLSETGELLSISSALLCHYTPTRTHINSHSYSHKLPLVLTYILTRTLIHSPPLTCTQELPSYVWDGTTSSGDQHYRKLACMWSPYPASYVLTRG